MSKDIYVKILDFPNTKVSEAVSCNSDGSYTIFLNAKMSDKKQTDALVHALGHIHNDDFDKNDVQDIEYHAHRGD